MGHDAQPVQETLALDALPHRPPFRFVTSAWRCATECDGVEGAWRITGHEAFFAGHFPDDPIVPGVLITEALAQLCGLAALGATTSIAAGPASAPALLVHAEMRFRSVVRPPALIQLRARLDRTIATLLEFEVSASVSNTRVSEGRLTIRHAPTTGGE